MVTHIPTWFHGRPEEDSPLPEAVLNKRVVKHHNVAAVQYLVRWMGFPDSEST